MAVKLCSNHTKPILTRRAMTLVYYTGGKSSDPRVPDSPLVKHKRERPGDVVESYDGTKQYRVAEDGSLRRMAPKLGRKA